MEIELERCIAMKSSSTYSEDRRPAFVCAKTQYHARGGRFPAIKSPHQLSLSHLEQRLPLGEAEFRTRCEARAD